MKKHFDTIKVLIDTQAIDRRQQDSGGRNLLYQAVKTGCGIEDIKYLVKKMGESAHCRTVHNQTPLEAELKYRGNLEIAKYLYESGGKEIISHQEIMDAACIGYMNHDERAAYNHFVKLPPETK